VAVAAAYHSVRAATPQHREHRFVVAATAALYRPLRAEVWGGRRLIPLTAPWTGSDDSFDRAVHVLEANGVRVSAWVVLTHNSALGRKRKDLAVRNCFGDSYEYALCPANAEVREFAALLASEAVRELPLEGVSLEACGQLGATHGSHHEKTVGSYAPLAEQILSICCCDACQRVWDGLGIDADATVQTLRAAYETAQNEAFYLNLTPGDVLDSQVAATLLTVRQSHTDALFEEVVSAVHSTDSALSITLHAQADPWATGASPGLTPKSARLADAVLVPVEPTSHDSTDAIASMRNLVTPEVSVAAYVNLLGAIEPDDFDEHATRLLHAGADELHLYHLGLANRRQLPLFSRLASLGS